jgi:hypothetical protein
VIFYQRGKMKCAAVAQAYSTMLRVFPLVYWPPVVGLAA